MTPRPKTLLCRPRAGFNDNLVQIERCWAYAEAHGRRLIVDATRESFCDPLDRYFEPLDPRADVRLRLDRRTLRGLHALPVRPAVLQGRLSRYVSVRDSARQVYVDSGTRVPTTFDFDVDHDEPLLVHETSGGGFSGADALVRMRFTAELASAIRARLAELPPRYVAIHVRNSDLKTDYRALFESLRDETRGEAVLICSDDPECKAFAQRFFGESTVFEATATPRYSGRALHLDRRLKRLGGATRLNRQMLTDLMAMTSAERLYYGDVASRKQPAGFSHLAGDVHARKGLVETLLSNADDPGARRRWSFARWIRR